MSGYTYPWFGVVPPHDPFDPYRPYPLGESVTTDRLVMGRVDPPVIAQGWECPKCKVVYAPSVEKCKCSKGKGK